MTAKATWINPLTGETIPLDRFVEPGSIEITPASWEAPPLPDVLRRNMDDLIAGLLNPDTPEPERT